MHRWATDNGSGRTVARSHFVLSAVFQELGDVSVALEHAVRSVDVLAEDAEPAMRIDHLTRLGDCLALNGDVAGARALRRGAAGSPRSSATSTAG